MKQSEIQDILRINVDGRTTEAFDYCEVGVDME